MANFDRVGDTGVSWIWGLATISTASTSSAGDHPFLPRQSSGAPAHERAAGGATSCARPSDPAALARPAAVVRHRRDVLDPDDLQAGRGERPDGGLAARAGALDEDVDLLQAVLLGPAGGGLGGELRGERGGLPRALEPHVAGARPRQGVALAVGDRDDRVVERGLDVGLAVDDVLLLAPAGLLRLGLGHGLLPLLPLHADALLRSLAGSGVRVRPLPVHRERAPVAQALVARDLDLPLDVLRHVAAEV